MKPTKTELEHFYNSRKLTTREIGDALGVSKTQVLRWMRSYEIAPRANGRGLAHRGLEQPTKQELEKLVHEDHLPYSMIAAIYGVDLTAIPHWLKKHGIPKPKIWDTRRKGIHPRIPTRSELTTLYVEQKTPMVEIGEMFGVSNHTISDYLGKYGIEARPSGFDGKRITCNDGHIVMSSYEFKVDNWLHENCIDHIYEPKVPFHNMCRADFFAKGFYIEVWGVCKGAEYPRRKEYKQRMYKEHNLPLIEISWPMFAAARNEFWKKRLAEHLLSP